MTPRAGGWERTPPRAKDAGPSRDALRVARYAVELPEGLPRCTVRTGAAIAVDRPRSSPVVSGGWSVVSGPHADRRRASAIPGPANRRDRFARRRGPAARPSRREPSHLVRERSARRTVGPRAAGKGRHKVALRYAVWSAVSAGAPGRMDGETECSQGHRRVQRAIERLGAAGEPLRSRHEWRDPDRRPGHSRRPIGGPASAAGDVAQPGPERGVSSAPSRRRGVRGAIL